jgi:sugar/nucleoside kinase (ribokinase family)
MSYYASWGIIIDDIVFPDGRTAMGVLGGAGLYAASGMRLWSRDAVLISAVGRDFDASSLAPFGLDDSRLLVTDLPTPRAWQLFEEDGQRTQIFRVPQEVWYEQLVLPPSPQSIPAGLEAAHFIGRGDAREEEMIVALREAGVRLSSEPIIDETMTADERATLLRCLAHFEVFAPSTSELPFLVDEEQPVQAQLRALAALGPPIITLRQGAAGSLVYDREADQFWRVPAAEATVVDVTGAGNAYCGGFLVGWLESRDAHRAAAMAAVSAAAIIEQIGPPLIDDEVMDAVQWRAKRGMEHIYLMDDDEG